MFVSALCIAVGQAAAADGGAEAAAAMLRPNVMACNAPVHRRGCCSTDGQPGHSIASCALMEYSKLQVVRRLLKTVALRQVMGILGAMTFVRFGLEPLVKALRSLFAVQGSWEKSSEFYILREVRTPEAHSRADHLEVFEGLPAAYVSEEVEALNNCLRGEH